ncbi:uncharacterized protein ACOB8E_001432 [Sarcophilus harrisii]
MSTSRPLAPQLQLRPDAWWQPARFLPLSFVSGIGGAFSTAALCPLRNVVFFLPFRLLSSCRFGSEGDFFVICSQTDKVGRGKERGRKLSWPRKRRRSEIGPAAPSPSEPLSTFLCRAPGSRPESQGQPRFLASRSSRFSWKKSPHLSSAQTRLKVIGPCSCRAVGSLPGEAFLEQPSWSLAGAGGGGGVKGEQGVHLGLSVQTAAALGSEEMKSTPGAVEGASAPGPSPFLHSVPLRNWQAAAGDPWAFVGSGVSLTAQIGHHPAPAGLLSLMWKEAKEHHSPGARHLVD